MVERLERRALENARAGMVAVSDRVDARTSHLRRGWYWGSQSFAERMMKLAEKTLGRTKSRVFRGSRCGRRTDWNEPSNGCESGWQRRG